MSLRHAVPAAVIALGIALLGAAVPFALDWRSPFLASTRTLALSILLGAPLAIAIAQALWLRRRARPWPLVALSVLSLALAAVVFATVAFIELRLQMMRRAVLAADTATLHDIGARLVTGYRDLDDARRLVVQPTVAGIFLTTRNVQGRGVAAIRGEIDELQALRRTHGLPALLVATDQEGGVVSRMSPPLPRLPSLAKTIAQSTDAPSREQAARAYGLRQGEALASLGVNLNFAPVIDLKHGVVNPDDRMTRIDARALSADPALVQQTASAYCAALREHRVHCTLKHFPGLGRVFDDTHVRSATLAADPRELEQSDWLPFKGLMAAGEPLVMLAHVTLQDLDDTPVSFSRAIVSGLLRKNWKYDGVLVTDDFSMAAVTDSKDGISGAAIKALNAGVDLILIAYDPDQYFPVVHALMTAQREKAIDPALAEQTAQRLKRLEFPR